MGNSNMKLNTKLNTPQILLTAAFVATAVTIVDSFAEWDKAIYEGLLAAVMTFVGAAFAKIIFKDEN